MLAGSVELLALSAVSAHSSLATLACRPVARRLEAGRTQRAWDCAETALEAHPGSLPLFVARAECLHAMGRHRQAARDLEEALERLRLQGTVSAGDACKMVALGSQA